MIDLPPPAREAVEVLVRRGRMIEAIKLCREETGCSLLEAKRACEAIRDEPQD